MAAIALVLCPAIALANPAADGGLTTHWAALLSLLVFIVAYLLVIGEDALHLPKSKPVIVAAGIIWSLTAIVYAQAGDARFAAQAMRHNLLEFVELFLFLLAAMTYINTMAERGVFNALRVWLITKGFSFRAIFWVTGFLAFFISPVADNLTTALLMVAVVLAVGRDRPSFVVATCINIVVAANAGGAFSPFGDITTLMVWQQGVVRFEGFLALFIPSLVNWLIPAVILSSSIPNQRPEPISEQARLRHGAFVVVGLFILTIGMAVGAHNVLHMPPVLGMMTGLGCLKFYGYYLNQRDRKQLERLAREPNRQAWRASSTSRVVSGKHQLTLPTLESRAPEKLGFNVFKSLEHAEWDTLMFFYGIILCVGGLGALGYLTLMSHVLYGEIGATGANILVGLFSAIIDNIPIMFAVLSMMPDMSQGQWLLVTLTAGVGGSLLSIGSAAGVAVMGQARGIYTFFAHLRWSWAIALGYAASIWAHFLINADAF